MQRAGAAWRQPQRCVALLCVLIATTLLGACTAPQERTLSRSAPVGAFLPTGATPTDPDRVDPRVQRWGVIGAIEQLQGRPIQILELSGGGQYGAFGAGFLNGWTQSGTRPKFDLVTGISTGALLATHAFLGTPADDAVLKDIYTGIERGDIYRGSLLGGLFGGAALHRTDPMAALIEQTITPEVLERVAAEWDKNRRLFVATTNLDYKQVWVFSLSKIAKQGGPQALELYRKVLYAAASPPVVFPPVEIDGHLFGYASVRASLDDNAARLEDFVRALGTGSVDLVGHSLGGIVALRMLAKASAVPPGRLVCLGSPLCGSQAARELHGTSLGRAIVGRALADASVTENAAEWGAAVAARREIGVIAGSVPAGIGRLFAGFDEPNDGTVAVRETRLPGIADHLVMPVTHTGMVFSRDVADQAAAFLKRGRFFRDDP